MRNSGVLPEILTGQEAVLIISSGCFQHKINTHVIKGEDKWAIFGLLENAGLQKE